MNPVTYLPQSPRLLDQVSEVLRYRHYSLRTEQANRYWVRFSCAGAGGAGGKASQRDALAQER